MGEPLIRKRKIAGGSEGKIGGPVLSSDEVGDVGEYSVSGDEDGTKTASQLPLRGVSESASQRVTVEEEV